MNVNLIKAGILSVIVFLSIFIFGCDICVLFRPNKAYIPKVSIDVREDCQTYSASYSPDYFDRHNLAFHIFYGDRESVILKFEALGEIIIDYGNGYSERIVVQKKFRQPCPLTPVSYKFAFYEFNVNERGNIENCKISFNLQLKGNVQDIRSKNHKIKLISALSTF